MTTTTCKNCQHEVEPAKKGNDLECPKCKKPFGYFEQIAYKNKVTKERLAKERADANKRITRGLKK